MVASYTRQKEIKDLISQNEFSIGYSEQFVKDKKEEVRELKQKMEKIFGQEEHLSRRIEEAEISHMRTEHIFSSIERYATKINKKLKAIESRITNLLGDCVILSASVCYLGSFSIKERVELRKEMAVAVETTWRTPCSSFWKESALRSHQTIFKKIIQEYGMKKVVLPHSFSHILGQPVMIETLFTLIFAPSCPLVTDPTGKMQEFLQNHILSKLKVKRVFASDKNINFKVEQILRSNSLSILNDHNNLENENVGLSQQEPILQRLTSRLSNGFDFDYEKLAKLKELHTLGSFFNSFGGVNKRIPTNMPEFDDLSLYQVQIFTPRFEFLLGQDYMSKLTPSVVMNSDNDLILSRDQPDRKVEGGWLEVKEVMLKHFLPEEYQKIQETRERIKQFNLKKDDLNKTFENAFLGANQDTL
mmetsp:Transcript_23297/g.22889  ORF Transcript_23297/g.22889 Transcript_23297/m.22889 type:complete len:417 (+) Transcript_23297:1724-2974(+)